MADEHVLRIEFEGDDKSQRQDGGSPASQDQASQQRRIESDNFRESDEARKAHEESQRRFEDEARRNAASDSDRNLPTQEENPNWRTNPEVTEVDEAPAYSSSRDLVPYDPEFANAQGRLNVATSEYGPKTSAAASVAEDAASVAGAAGGGGGGAIPPAVEAAGAAGAAGAGALEAAGATLLTIVEPIGIVIAALAGMGIGIIGVTEALGSLHDSLLEQFEQVNGIIGAARAQQNVELLQKRMEVAQGLQEGATGTISAQTEMEKQLIELNGHMIQIIEFFLKPLYWFASQILAGVNWLLSWIGKSDAAPNFQQEAIDFLSNIPKNLIGQQDFRMKKVPFNPKRKTPRRRANP